MAERPDAHTNVSIAAQGHSVIQSSRHPVSQSFSQSASQPAGEQSELLEHLESGQPVQLRIQGGKNPSVQPVQLQGEQSELPEHLESEQPVQPQSVQPMQLQGEQSELLEHPESEQPVQPQGLIEWLVEWLSGWWRVAGQCSYRVSSQSYCST